MPVATAMTGQIVRACGHDIGRRVADGEDGSVGMGSTADLIDGVI